MKIDRDARIPLGLGALLSQTFGLLGRHLGTFLLIAVPPLILAGLVTLVIAPGYFAAPENQGSFSDRSPGMLYVLGGMEFLIGCVLTGTLALAAYDATLGDPVRAGAAFEKTREAVVPLLVTGVIFAAIMAVGLVLLVLPGLYIAARFAVIPPVIMVENTGVSAAFTRAAALSQGYRWPIVAAYLVIFACMLGLSFGVDALPIYVLGAVPDMLIYALVGGLTYALSAIFTAVLYARLREIKEGSARSDLSEVFA